MSWRSKSYEVLPALSIRGWRLRDYLRRVTVAWMFGIVWMSIIGGARINYFGRMIGFTDFHFGLLSAIPFIATFGQLVAAILIEKTGLTKQQFLVCGTIHRMLWLAVAAIPLASMLPFLFGAEGPVRPLLPGRWAVWTMLLILLVSSFMSALMAPAWLTWMGDLIPRRIRGRYFANRMRITRLVSMPVVIGLAILLDYLRVPGAPMTATAQPALLWAICVAFAVAAVCGTIDILMFRGMREVVRTTPDAPRRPAIDIHVERRGSGLSGSLRYAAAYAGEAVRQVLIDPLGDKLFRRYVLFGATMTFGVAVGGPFFWRHMLETLGLNQVASDFLFMLVGPIVTMFSAPLWGKLIDRWGRRPVLLIGVGFACFSILPYFFSSPYIPNPQFLLHGLNRLAGFVGGWFGRPGWRWLSPQVHMGAWLIMACSPLMGGLGWSAIALAQNNIILGFADGSGRSKYVAASAVLISFGGIIGGVFGGWLAQSLDFLQDQPIRVGVFLWNNWHATFLVAWLARVTGLLLVARMPDPGSKPIRDIARVTTLNVYNFLSTGLFYRLRIFGWGRSRRRRDNR